MFRNLCVVTLKALAIASAPLAARAQTAFRSHEVDVAATYNAQHSNLITESYFWLQGGSLDLSTDLSHGLGGMARLSGENAGNLLGSRADLAMITAVFGPRYCWRPRSRKYTLFGDVLIGASHGFHSDFPIEQGSTSSDVSFALETGGGIDFRLSHHLAIRAIEADWLRTQFPNSTTNVQNNLSLGAGIVFRFVR